jgi:hypothetical protein
MTPAIHGAGDRRSREETLSIYRLRGGRNAAGRSSSSCRRGPHQVVAVAAHRAKTLRSSLVESTGMALTTTEANNRSDRNNEQRALIRCDSSLGR